MIKRLLILFFLLPALGSRAQSYFAGWYTGINSWAVSKRTSLMLDVNLRTTDQWKQLQTIVIRPGFSWQINQQAAIGAGYTYLNRSIHAASASGHAEEHVLWQQLVFTRRFPRFTVVNRPRIEERFIEKLLSDGSELKHAGYANAYRFRYLTKANFAMNKQPKFLHGWYSSASAELQLNIGDKSAVNGKTYEQFRVYGGAGFRFSKKLDIEAGYQYRDIATRTEQHIHEHIAQLTTYLRI